MKITNNGKVTDRLIGGTFVAAGQFEVHETQMQDNVMRMRRLDKGLEIPPGATVELRPGSYHVMFIGLQSGLKEGERVKGTLVFEKAGKVEVEYKIEALGSNPAGAKAPAGKHSGHH
jgi:copper(I)-binding protein